MKCLKNELSKQVLFAAVGLCLLLPASAALCADIPGKTSTTRTLPGQTSTTRTLPGQTTTQTVPLQTIAPSMEYQHVDKPPVKTLDIPDYDIAGEIRNVNFMRDIAADGKESNRLSFQLALINHGKRKFTGDIPLKLRGINDLNNTLFSEEYPVLINQDIKNDYWIVNWVTLHFTLGANGAPHDIKDVRLIVDIDPNNTLHEAQKYRRNNHCEFAR